jgi:DNA-binding GntR family transcriptional regulator
LDNHLFESTIQSNRPLHDQVYQRLKQAIIAGRLQPGEHLVETKIAQQLGVSRNPVREAIRRLEQEQLVSAAGKGMVVGSLTRTSIEEVYAIRAVLEALGCRLAAQHITKEQGDRLREILEHSRAAIAADDLKALTTYDIEFHKVLIDASRNATLKKVLDQLRDSVLRFRTASIALPGRPKQVLKDHTAIAKAVIAGDGARAEVLVHDHILQASQRLLESLKDNFA